MSVYPIEDKVNPTAKDDIETKIVDTDLANQGYIETDDQTALALYEIPDDERRRLLRRLDSRIAPLVMILYLIAFLDRSNIGNAAVGGMTADLNFPSNGLSVATSIFYATYVILEVPFTTLLRTLRPSRLIPGVVLVWGGVVLGMGFSTNYATILATRLLLGGLEAALTPCLMLYLTTFYQRNELALRMCYLFISAALSGCVGGLIAAGFLKMDGLAGIEGWRWIFIIEGALTIVVGIISAFIIADRWQDATYLSDRQLFLMKVRDAKAAMFSKDDGFSTVEIKKAFTDPMIYLSGLGQFLFDVCLYGFSTFLVVIINQLGFDRIESQAMTAPVYFVAAMVYLIGALISDKYSIRWGLMFPMACVSIVGYVLLCAVHNNAVKLFACFLAGAGIYICVGLHFTWIGQNIAGFRKRSVAIGMQQAMGNTGGIVAGQIYRSTDSPRYLLGHAVSLGCMAGALGVITLEYFIWKRRNTARDAMSQEQKLVEDDAGIDGDKHHSFRYAL
ncbi:major facilitator superfamily transporter [Filobasidium floriforme]|uniref:major facilitator superfamily transporter n=1 Tax=Filobasidium floriforme TaxID=5210 RepID=UPI001E8E344E|nr:major facilitator superfamily transporter [Filobasidium floriforme]KAH8085656.1 major facilitator superfamily transporter [Filobasidium floriforme]